MRYWRDCLAVCWCIAVGVVLVIGAARCSAAQPACAVIDVAHTACEYVNVTYRAPDGTVRTERVPASELATSAERTRLANAARDGGAP